MATTTDSRDMEAGRVLCRRTPRRFRVATPRAALRDATKFPKIMPQCSRQCLPIRSPPFRFGFRRLSIHMPDSPSAPITRANARKNGRDTLFCIL